MKVVAFIGPSGTGKSHRATWVAGERSIDYIIDDGLLIKGTTIIGGNSAKKEGTRVASVKRALFINNSHAEKVRSVISTHKPESILILGTSDKMVEQIAKNLSLPEISEKVYIVDVASEFEIKQALTTRKSQGKHVIPVPTFEIKKEFSGYFLDPLQIFKRRGKASYQLVGEKSVVRPTFSYLGQYTISDYTIYQIVEYVTSNTVGVSKISRFRLENFPDGIYIEIDLVLVYGYVIKTLLQGTQQKIKNTIENLTSLNIRSLNLTAKSLVVNNK